MSHPKPATLIQQLARRVAGEAPAPAASQQQIPVANYCDPARFEQERQRLFLRLPQIVGHTSQLPAAGDALVYDWLGLPLITVRDKDGRLGTFRNVCRHRGMRLVQEQGVTRLRSLVCPYHQWTYGLDGALRNVPREETFTAIDHAGMGLAPVACEERHGLIWVQVEGAMDLDAHLAGLGADLDEFRLAEHHFCDYSVRRVAANWKLIQDAFLDAYHVTRLHKDTVGRFFPDSMAESDLIGRHTRSAVARNEIAEVPDLAPSRIDLRRHATFSYTLFPGSVLVFQPDYPAVISIFPQGPDESIFVHAMLTPQPPASDEERDHFHRSFELIDKGVFAAEDIFVAVGAQQGLRSGANDHLTFGGLEAVAVRFHQFIDQALAE